MKYNELIYYTISFIQVVKSGNFTKAAKSSGISKAQLSRHVNDLEKILETQLFYRSTRHVVLTEQGKQYYDNCRTIEETCSLAVNDLKGKVISGLLRITAPTDFGIQFLSSVIYEFSKSFPHTNVALSLSSVEENIIEKNYDLAIRIANQLPDSSLQVRTIASFKRIICASPAYFSGKTIPTHPKELKDHVCITSINHNSNLLFPQWVFKLDGKIVNFKLEKFIEVDSLSIQRDLIKSGVGIGRLPNYFVQQELSNGELVEVLADTEKPNSYIYALYPNSKVPQAKTRAFIDLLKKIALFDL